MRSIEQGIKFAYVYIVVLGCSCMGNIDRLELIMPRYAIRGGSVVLKCEHSVTPEQLYKVEWQKAGAKIFQYIKDRKPPFRYFPMPGAELNKTNSNERQIELARLDFAASGSYSCGVSMETPIFSKDSEMVTLNVIEPQNRDPTITFDKTTYEVGDVLQANCTTAAARPPPHITWLINGEKVDEMLTRSFSNGRLNGHGYFEQRAPAMKQLTIQVSELHAGGNGELWLTCMSTIPGYVSPNERYADERRHSVRIEVVMTEMPAEIISAEESNVMESSTSNQAPTNAHAAPAPIGFLLLFTLVLVLARIQPADVRVCV
ncbi:uncharacterized protein [Atheta coriaria]|uniref:uncharacterized protein n=1 Tax=Dalotia coriaria TaxID=877792 RepID=UPI0031F33A6E